MLITGDELPNPDSRLSPVQTDDPVSPKDGEEEALESHEVIELQQFSERKAWIEEKIKVNVIHFNDTERSSEYLNSFSRACHQSRYLSAWTPYELHLRTFLGYPRAQS
jgi:hypothetical protein